MEIGIILPADKEILYQPEYWSDRADDIRRFADALREEPDFFKALHRQADICEQLARKAMFLKQKRSGHMRKPPKYFFRNFDETFDADHTAHAPVVDINLHRRITKA